MRRDKMVRRRATIPTKEERMRRRQAQKESMEGSVYRRCLKATSPKIATDTLTDMGVGMIWSEVGDAVIIENVRQIAKKESELCGLPKITKKKQTRYHDKFLEYAERRKIARKRDNKAHWNEKMLEVWEKGNLKTFGFNCYCGDIVIVRSRRSRLAWDKELKRRKAVHKGVYGRID
jgi:hypothetical protein